MVIQGPFNDDPIVVRECDRLVTKYSIKQIIETGTSTGATTECLAKYGLPVHTIEIVSETYVTAKQRLADSWNITCHQGDSGVVIRRLLTELPKTPTLFYLDAHWENHWPLLEELSVIKLLAHPGSVIIIDDFCTPNRDYQFDHYNGVYCDLPYVRWYLPHGTVHYCLDKSERPALIGQRPVGKLYVVPADGADELCVRFSNLA